MFFYQSLECALVSCVSLACQSSCRLSSRLGCAVRFSLAFIGRVWRSVLSPRISRRTSRCLLLWFLRLGAQCVFLFALVADVSASFGSSRFPSCSLLPFVLLHLPFLWGRFSLLRSAFLFVDLDSWCQRFYVLSHFFPFFVLFFASSWFRFHGFAVSSCLYGFFHLLCLGVFAVVLFFVFPFPSLG